MLTLSHWVVLPLSDGGSDVLWGLLHPLTPGLSDANSPATLLKAEFSIQDKNGKTFGKIHLGCPRYRRLQFYHNRIYRDSA